MDCCGSNQFDVFGCSSNGDRRGRVRRQTQAAAEHRDIAGENWFAAEKRFDGIKASVLAFETACYRDTARVQSPAGSIEKHDRAACDRAETPGLVSSRIDEHPRAR